MTVFKLLLASDRAILIQLLREFNLRAMDYRGTGKSKPDPREPNRPYYVRYERRRGRIVQPVRRVYK